jgi:beta-glucanase (GH16 family)
VALLHRARAVATANSVAVAVAVLMALAFALVLATSGCDTSPLYPDMESGPPPGPHDGGTVLPGSDMISTDLATPPPDPSRTLAWHDEFDGPAGAPPDSTRWTFDVGGDGWGNSQLEYDTNRPQNVQLDGNGRLLITALREVYMGHAFTSGRITTINRYTKAYGRFEARIQMPRGRGMWPAFWLLGGNVGDVGWPDCGEIDIVENKGQEAYTVHGTVHGPGYSGGQGVSSYKNLLGMPLADDFHLYAVEWSPNSLVFSVDQFEYFTITPSQLPIGKRWVFDHPFGILLDLAVGGNYVGPPDSTTPFPQTMVVDYVRVYEPAP